MVHESEADRAAGPDDLLSWSVISAGVFYRDGMKPLKLAYNADLLAAIQAGRQAERAEILDGLGLLVESVGGEVADGVYEAIRLIQGRGLAKKEGEG